MMIDMPEVVGKAPRDADEGGAAGASVDLQGSKLSMPVGESNEAIALLEETLTVSKRQVVTGTVRVSTRTETYDDVAEVLLQHDIVDVTRVAIGRLVDIAPSVRTEGDTTIVPVIEERFVIVKQLYLTEELHIRRHVEQETSRTPVQLRRQHAVVESVDATGAVVDGSSS